MFFFYKRMIQTWVRKYESDEYTDEVRRVFLRNLESKITGRNCSIFSNWLQIAPILYHISIMVVFGTTQPGGLDCLRKIAELMICDGSCLKLKKATVRF